MKDAFGGVFILRIMIIFFVIFVCFMTFAISFARIFRVKNSVISILEKYDADKAETKIVNYLKEINYPETYSINKKIIDNCSGQIDKNFSKSRSFKFLNGNINGVCIVPSGTEDSYYYKVTAYLVMDFPLFSADFIIPITGETKTFSKVFY